MLNNINIAFILYFKRNLFFKFAFEIKKLTSLPALVNMNFQRILPWILISGLIFSLLSYVANRYHGKERNVRELAQDFIGGSIFVSLLSAIVPDIFPDISNNFSLKLGNFNLFDATKIIGNSISSASVNTFGGGSSKADDIDLQIGPLPGR